MRNPDGERLFLCEPIRCRVIMGGKYDILPSQRRRPWRLPALPMPTSRKQIGCLRIRSSRSWTAKGYTHFGKVEADDGHWELEADLKSVRYDLHVDPKSGEITKSERDDD
jgi:hypothetical protein